VTVEPAEGARQGSGFLRFFGLETSAKAKAAVLWMLPYLGLLCGTLAGLSYLVDLLLPQPLWVYATAIVLAAVYFFFFLARMRQMSLDAQESAAEPKPEAKGK
jgi:phosphotransferase system  glucose/maltose/N-acetylglucosamine-specific IIC component